MIWGNGIANFDRNLAIVIGIDVYKNSKDIHQLSTAVSDANAVADLLEEKYPYNATDKNPQIIRLCNEEATLDGIRNLLHNRLPNELKPTDQDRLIVYFAGHGLPKNSDEGPTGYLVPHDAEISRNKSFLPMQEVYDVLVELNCHHLLVVLDCCFAGTFRWATSRKLIAQLETVHKEHYDRFIRYPAWQVITSAAYDQEALDFVKLSADRRGQVDNQPHSPFALALLEALQDGVPDAQGKQYQNADFTKDGVVTAHELIVYLNDRVSELSKDRQVPGLYPLKQEYDKGEFVFVKPDFDPTQLQDAPTLNDDNNPYRGLKSFGERHAGFFFGRQKLVEELSDRLNKSPSQLTVVLGTSGSGKSSLVKAGLIPHLRQKSLQPEATQHWYILNPLRPGKSPFIELARSVLPLVHSNLIPALAQVGFLDQKFQEILDTNSKQKSKPNQEPASNATTDLVKLAQRWQTASPEAKLLIIVDYFTQLQTLEPAEQDQLSSLRTKIKDSINSVIQFFQQDFNLLADEIVKWSLSQPNTKLLLVIDQFEELLTMTESDRGSLEQEHLPQGDELQEWRRFLSLLQVVLGKNQQQLRVVVTLRSDFEPRFLNSPLKDYWQAARFPIRAMSSDELREAIEGPALKQALYFNPPELVSKLIDEVGQMPGALPLLSFTLSELYSSLYKRWKEAQDTDRALQEADYQALGGVAGALTRRATEEYETFDKAYQATMRRLMLRMVVIDGGGVARRRVPDAELIYSDMAETDRMAQMRERLVAARLLVKGQEADQGYLEPAHDFLVRGWDKLQGWIKEEQDNLALQRRLTLAANDWHDTTDNRDDLLWIRDPRLMIFEEGLESSDWLNKKEAEFAKASIAQRDNELDNAQTQLLLSEERRVIAELREKAITAKYLSKTYPREALEMIIQAMSENLEKLPNIIDVVQISLHEVTEFSLLHNSLRQYTDCDDTTLHLWQTDWHNGFKLCCNRLAYYLISQDPKMGIITNKYCNDCLTHSWNSQDLLMIFMRQGQSDEEAKKSTASALIKKGGRLSKTGKIESAIVAYEEAQQIDPKVIILASDWGTLSWFGCLHGYASHSQILVACEKAVAAEPDAGQWQDVRGLAKALQGEKYFPEAIKDFQVFITWTTDTKKRSQRKSWINYLKQNKKGACDFLQRKFASLGFLLVLLALIGLSDFYFQKVTRTQTKILSLQKNY
jgi:tetratricopeptide (TPR) repeat protein